LFEVQLGLWTRCRIRA